jgi:hypothetical protein
MPEAIAPAQPRLFRFASSIARSSSYLERKGPRTSARARRSRYPGAIARPRVILKLERMPFSTLRERQGGPGHLTQNSSPPKPCSADRTLNFVDRACSELPPRSMLVRDVDERISCENAAVMAIAKRRQLVS